MHLVMREHPTAEAEHSSLSLVRSGKRGLVFRWAKLIATALGGRWSGRSTSSRCLQVVETLSLGPRKQLLLIRCDGAKYLVATGPDSVQTILRVDSRGNAAGYGKVAAELGDRS